MKKFRKILMTLPITFCLLVLVSMGGLAHASTKTSKETSKEKTYDQIRKHMKANGSTDRDITSVIQKLKKGKLLDSEIAIKKGKSVHFSNVLKPDDDSTSADSVFATDEHPEQIYRYPDGSFIKVSLEIQNNTDLMTNNVLTPLSSSYYKTVKVMGSDLFGSESYYARIYINNSPVGDDFIDKLYGADFNRWFSSVSDVYFHIERKYEIRSKNITAKAYMHFYLQDPGHGFTSYLKVHAGDKINDKYGIWVAWTAPVKGSASYQ